MNRYPFTPQFLDALPEELTELFRNLEDTLLREICSRLSAADQLNQATVEDIKALRAHGIDLKEIQKAIEKIVGIGEDKLNELLDDVVDRNQKYYTEVIDIAKLAKPDVIVETADIAAIVEQCQREYGNITRSMGFLVDNGRTMLEPAKAYQWALDNATMQVQSGAVSYEQAIKSAVKQLAGSGLKTVNYESAHVDSVDVAVRRAVMTGVNQLNRKFTEQSMDFLETDLVEVSAHYGARNIDGPNGWENHEKWQGKLYRWEMYARRYSGPSKGQYPDFERSCGYGDVTGILGANCRHSYHPYVEGIMEPTYSRGDLDRMKGENNKVIFDGKEYDGYQATQMQRRLERTIRKQKRLKNAYRAAGLKGDATAANAKLRRLNTKYTEFSEAAGLIEQPERTRMAYIDGATTAKAQQLRAQRDAEAAAKAQGCASEMARVNRAESDPAPAKLPRYIDVTAQWHENATPNSHEVQDAQEYTKDGVVYKVDGHDVKLDYSSHEKEIAELLEKEFGGELIMNPKVNNPQGVRVPDFQFRGEGWDLKTLTKKATQDTIFQRVKKSSGQAKKFVIDVTGGIKLTDADIEAQIKKIFSHNDTLFTREIILIRDMKILRVLKRA